jgi:hypothetical protein
MRQRLFGLWLVFHLQDKEQFDFFLLQLLNSFSMLSGSRLPAPGSRLLNSEF